MARHIWRWCLSFVITKFKDACSSLTLLKVNAGVAAGSTRAALTLHFAKQNNAADISAKEGPQVHTCSYVTQGGKQALCCCGLEQWNLQETATTLVGMLLGMAFTHVANGKLLQTPVSN